jgi:divalent metal cation (Fe/Co/Zn/Cd) transporter
VALARSELVRRGKTLTYTTLALCSLEASVALVAGLAVGSVALLGFAVDSLIELAAGVTALWRLSADFDFARRVRVERTSLHIIGACFLALAVYVTYEAGRSLVLRERPTQSFPGIALAVVSLVTPARLAHPPQPDLDRPWRRSRGTALAGLTASRRGFFQGDAGAQGLAQEGDLA